MKPLAIVLVLGLADPTGLRDDSGLPDSSLAMQPRAMTSALSKLCSRPVRLRRVGSRVLSGSGHGPAPSRPVVGRVRRPQRRALRRTHRDRPATACRGRRSERAHRTRPARPCISPQTVAVPLRRSRCCGTLAPTRRPGTGREDAAGPRRFGLRFRCDGRAPFAARCACAVAGTGEAPVVPENPSLTSEGSGDGDRGGARRIGNVRSEDQCLERRRWPS